ncbi:hypothetical protein KC340_g5022 [Hortaea werneckii]|nr:hypothetical protein KC342_g11984 [Hortaea werneckii]KAI7105076.1 hypothetical protein KC339_g4095 [Hortaea werneckii]KAI7221725.1 hypothetical protein KC365_g11624 [Hortaea werneckii]KAI7328622.1 hypothetical protein KC340_g5022 [Hortaea werneckii]KAI7393046.1 hypothetical protein KC328_g6788 [Hortaea werneckii]
MSSVGSEYDAQTYWKEQDFQTSARLHLQHWIWNYQLGYQVHPLVDIGGARPLKIADVACGNGAWLLEVQRKWPMHEYHGFDLTSSHFPGSPRLPENVNLSVWDLFTNIPAHMQGAFDIVHIRAIASAVRNNDVQPIVQKLLGLLKPGGYLQWDEQDSSTLKCRVVSESTDTKSSMKTLVAVQKALHAGHGMLWDWFHDLPPTLEKANCEIMVSDVFNPSPELSRAWADNLLTVCMGVIDRIPERDMLLPKVSDLPQSISRKSYAELVQKAAVESTKGAWMGMNQVVIVAKKSG